MYKLLEKNSVEDFVNEVVTDSSEKFSVIKKFREIENFDLKPPSNSLSEFVFNNDIEGLKSCLENKTYDLNQRDNSGLTCSWTPLYWSVKLRHVECMKLLLDFGSDVNLVVNDSEECCGTVLDLATIRDDLEIEDILREFAEKDDINFGQSFKAIRTKLRGKAPAFNFRYYKNT
jgi:hypothetical protein